MITQEDIKPTKPPHNFQFTYKGVKVSQKLGVEEALESLQKFNPEGIIEIGTNFGGLTFMLENSFDCPLLSFDIVDKGFKPSKATTHKVVGNIFTEKAIQTMKEFWSNKTPIILFCDGGNKAAEFNKFAPMLRSGDIVLGHDYSYDKKTFKEEVDGKIWNWHELEFNKLKGLWDTGEYEYVDEELFNKYVWTCWKKK